MTQITTTTETITPAIAAEYLKANAEDNRPINRATILRYAEIMKKGEWTLNNDSICLDVDNRLINGQHRLHACIEAGVPFMAIVVRNVDHSVYTTMDCGRARAAGQLLGKDVPNYGYVAGAIRSAYQIELGMAISRRPSKYISLDNTAIVNLFNSDRERYIDAGKFASQILRNAGKRFITPSIIGGYYYYLTAKKWYPEDKVRYFFESICSFKTCENETLEVFRLRMMKDISSNTHMPLEYKLNLLNKTWNAYVTGKTLKKISWDKEREGKIEIA